MKKLVWIMLLLIPLCSVKAESYYSDYSEWKEVEKIPNIDSDLFEIKEEKQYLWYKKEKEGNYFKEGEDHSEYPIGTEFYRYTDWSSWNSVKIDETNYREVENRKVYYYKVMKPILYIRLSPKKGNSATYLNIHVYKNNKEISFNQYNQNDDIIFELSEPCYVDELEISFTVLDNTSDEKAFQIDWLNKLSETAFMEVYTRAWFEGTYLASYKYSNMNQNLILWEDERISYEKMDASIHQIVTEKLEYRYRERMNYYEKENKIYSDIYSSVPLDEFPYKDMITEKIIYKVRIREKFEFDRNEFISLEEFTNEINKLKNEISLKQQEIERLEGDILSKEEKVEILKQKLLLNQQDSDLLNKEIEKLQEEILNSKNNVATLKDELNKKEIEINNLKAQIILGEKTIDTLSQISKEKELECLNNEKLKSQLEEANATIMSITNEQSRKLEVENSKSKEPIEIKKQSLSIPIFLFLIFIMIGICISRIVAMKKKV